ncbi:MAG: MFS transporter [Actinomycetes bacterium]
MSRRDTLATAGGAAVYSVSLGSAVVALPLLALEAGYSVVQVGVLVALSAVTQMLGRVGMGAWMNRFADWTFVVAASVLLVLSSGLAALSTAAVPFVLAHLLQGVSRAFFWTGTQTHAVRGDRPAVQGMALVNLSSATGLLAGPLLAGAVGEVSLSLAMAVSAGLGALGLVPAALLDRLPPFSPPQGSSQKRIWRRPGVDAGCWAGASAGAWRGLIGSYVPVALDAARLSPSLIGVLIAVANAAQLVGSAAVTRVAKRLLVRSLVVGTVTAGLGVGVVGLLAGNPWLAGAALAVSGLGAGVLQTAGPAVAVENVHPQERGAVMAASGTFRAAALMVSPLAAAALVAVAPVWVALAVGGGLILTPVRSAWRVDRRPGPDPTDA